MAEEAKSSMMPMLLGSVAAIAIVLALVAFLPRGDASEDMTEAAPVATTPAVTPEAPEPVAEAAAAPEPAPEVQADAPETPVVAAIRPTFDTFRVEPDGSMVIAGQAEPGQIVDIMLAGEAIERVEADASGAFVALPMAGPSDQPRRLSLLGDPDGAALASDTSYIVAPIARPDVIAAAPAPEAAEPLPEPTTDTPTGGLEAPQAPDTALALVAPEAPPTVLQADEDGVRVVQGGPSLTPPEAEPNVALDAITYDPEGEVQLSGRATGDGAVQVYIDNEPVTASPVTEGGDWRIDLPEIDTGVYTLRIDEVDSQGDVVSRLETPFKREEPAEVAAVLAEETNRAGFEVAVKTVQPGMTLWAIAEENLGDGILYVEVFAANHAAFGFYRSCGFVDHDARVDKGSGLQQLILRLADLPPASPPEDVLAPG